MLPNCDFLTGVEPGYDWARMLRLAIYPCLLLLAGCAVERAAMSPRPPNPEAGEVLQAAELARVRCLLVAPFENGSDSPNAGETATAALLSGIDPARTRVFPIHELRAIFRDTPLELPQGLSPSLALELAELVGADAALYGSVDGHAGDPSAELIVTVRLALAGSRHLLFAESTPVRSTKGERPDAALRRALLTSSRLVLSRLGDAGRRRCFEPERTRALRKFAVAQVKCPPVATDAFAAPARPEPLPCVAASPATPKAEPKVDPGPAKAEPKHTPRQTDWAKRLVSGTRFMVEDVSFAGRTARIQRDPGLQDLAVALQAQPAVAIRIEGFVDRTADRNADAKLSTVMARAAAERLAALGVTRQRLSHAGRGGESPLLPNFTARGRAANRRLEVVVVR